MKKILFLLTLILSMAKGYSQNVGIGTSIPNGKLHIKGTSDTSQLVIDANTTQGKIPLIRLRSAGGTDLLHIHADTELNAFFGITAGANNNGGIANTFIGSNAGVNNRTGNYNTAIGRGSLFYNDRQENTAVGFHSLFSNIGSYNTAVGSRALESNSLALYNTALGYSALQYNTNSHGNTAIGSEALATQSFNLDPFTSYYTHNTAVGLRALFSNNPTNSINGIYNTAVGSYSLSNNATGAYNSAFGTNSLNNNNTGDYNSAFGRYSLYNNSTGVVNTAVGYNSLYYNTTGSYNTALGSGAGPGAGYTNLNNIVCIGNIATATASDQIVLGNASNNQFYCYAAYATIAGFANLGILSNGQIGRIVSSGRYKKNITDLEINTSDIYKLRPVSYTFINGNSRHFGLIAEEVADVIPQLAEYAPEKNVVKGSTSDKLIPDAVQYPLLSVLLLKEAQKHEMRISSLQQIIEQQQQKIDLLEKRLSNLENEKSLHICAAGIIFFVSACDNKNKTKYL